MRTRFLKPRTWVALFLVAVAALVLWPRIHQVIAVAAVQDSLQRGWEISFDSQSTNPAIPEFIDTPVQDLIDRLVGDTSGYDGSQPAPTRNRDVIYLDRYQAFFRGPIHEIHIYYMEAFRGDLGAALARFPGLRCVTVEDNEQGLPTEAEWKLLCTRFRALPDLEELVLGGAWITDAALAPLSGHPKIRKVTMLNGRLSDKCIETFASMPRLNELWIEGMEHGDTEWPGPENQKTISAALPSVKFGVTPPPTELEQPAQSSPP